MTGGERQAWEVDRLGGQGGGSRTDFLVNIILLIRRSVKGESLVLLGFSTDLWRCPLLADGLQSKGGRLARAPPSRQLAKYFKTRDDAVTCARERTSVPFLALKTMR